VYSIGRSVVVVHNIIVVSRSPIHSTAHGWYSKTSAVVVVVVAVGNSAPCDNNIYYYCKTADGHITLRGVEGNWRSGVCDSGIRIGMRLGMQPAYRVRPSM